MASKCDLSSQLPPVHPRYLAEGADGCILISFELFARHQSAGKQNERDKLLHEDERCFQPLG